MAIMVRKSRPFSGKACMNRSATTSPTVALSVCTICELAETVTSSVHLPNFQDKILPQGMIHLHREPLARGGLESGAPTETS